ncbi:MAG: CPBP family intramembrane metalloprotease [Oscillospiraceae bacterium]|nr:CPBP family intramembrane metalloprotease [Oscillospiraceae bacterium]
MDNFQTNQDELFPDYEAMDIPEENNPFCNPTENSSFSEPYSQVIPTFFFRNRKCGKKPLKYEKKQLRYYYNTAGVILTSKLFIETALCLLFYIVMFLCSVTESTSFSLYYSALSDTTVRYAFRTVAVIVSTLSVFTAGCRFSSLKPASLFKKCSSFSTVDIVSGFMTGIFTAAVANVIMFLYPGTGSGYGAAGLRLDKDITQTAMVCIYICIAVPVTEGLIFRGIVLRNLSRASQRTGIIATSFLCALSTCSFPAMIPAFLMSVLLCRMTVKYSSVVPSVLIHITVNLSSMIISVYNTYAWDSDVLLIKIWTVITMILGGVFTFVMIFRMPLPKNRPEQRSRSLPLILSSAFIVLLVPLYIVTSFAEFLYLMYV